MKLLPTPVGPEVSVQGEIYLFKRGLITELCHPDKPFKFPVVSVIPFGIDHVSQQLVSRKLVIHPCFQSGFESSDHTIQLHLIHFF